MMSVKSSVPEAAGCSEPMHVWTDRVAVPGRRGRLQSVWCTNWKCMCSHFQIRKVVRRDEGICSNLRVVRDLFHAVLQLVGAFFKHLSLNSSRWYVKTLWQ